MRMSSSFKGGLCQPETNHFVNSDRAVAHGHQQAPGTDIQPGTRCKHTGRTVGRINTAAQNKQ